MREIVQDLSFDETTHRYFLKGRFVLSVTQILDLAGITDFSSVHPDILKRACAFGTAAHKATELHDRKVLDLSSLDAPLVPYLSAWKLFCAKELSEMVEIEIPVYSLRFQFAGTPDRFALDKAGRLVLVDIKTSKELSPAVKLQTAGYEIAYEEMRKRKVARRIGVVLQDSGDYHMEEFKDKSDKDDFIACARIAAFKLKNGLKI